MKPVSIYQAWYREAEVLDRWANIYGGKRLVADWAHWRAAVIRLQAEVVKAWRIEELANWTDRQLRKSPRFYAWLSRP